MSNKKLPLDAWQRIIDNATPGPWRPDHKSWIEVNDITVYCGPKDDSQCLCNMGDAIACVDDKETAKQSYNNAVFICLARHSMGKLVDRVRLLEQCMSDIACLLADYDGWYNPEAKLGDVVRMAELIMEAYEVALKERPIPVERIS